MGLVLATGYKGSLTALLRDVPLEAEHPTFTSRSSVYQQGCVRHLFEFKELGNDTSTKDATKIVKSEYLRLRKHKIIPDKKYFPMTYEFVGRHTSTIHEGLGNFDYVSTGEPIFVEIVGPEIMYAWQFREAFAQTVGQAQECGLFSRAEALKEFKVKYQSYSGGVSTEPEVLTLSDLVPFFLILSVGLGANVSCAFMANHFCLRATARIVAGNSNPTS
ncbi:hypothetical protein HPB47_015762 [Ixodes persulcatus]|uniref:Uncharacterized protein n=1 Tax=Ixodes persulcatus TaxID=34615 RepID=A0AC60QTI1_IXOPE|nr:hypothetical protein HPB47_015762 [Ixodes persulcatus]